jgi:hypothetical protein
MRTCLAITVGLFFAPAAVMARDVGQPAMLTVSPRPDWFLQRDEYKAVLGWDVGTAGDVNGDGFDDVIIASPTLAEAGRVYVYFGSADGLKKSTIPSWTIEKGDEFGYATSTAGDVNGDGFDDVIIGAPFEDEEYAYYGSANGLNAGSVPDWTAVNGADSVFGYSVSIAGDVNGDGYDDVIVGAPGYDTNDVDTGEARVYIGSANGLSADPIWIAYGDRRLAEFGWSVSTAGDVNGDGYDDVIVGSPVVTFSGEQLAYGFYGSPEGPSANPNWVVTHVGDAGDTFGRSVAKAGDVNGDGFDDVIIGDAGFQFQLGVAYVYYGSAAGLSANPDWIGSGDDERYSEQFGHSVGTAGDVNGDGFDDVIVGAIGSENFGGRAYVYFGSSAGLRINPALRVKNFQTNAELGYSVGTAGDVNGDGLDDIIVGSPLFNETQTDGGLAVVYYGRRPRAQ